MSNAFKVMELTKKFPKMTSGQIGSRLSCDPAYVRAVWHRSGVFRGPHNPNVTYSSRSGKYVRLPIDEYRRLLAAAGESPIPSTNGPKS